MNSFSELLAQDVMNAPVLSTTPDADTDQVENQFLRHGVSAMPVVQHGQIVGVISRTDLMLLPALTAAIESGEQSLLVRDLMKRDVVRCAPDTPLGAVAADMVHRHVHHVLVVRDEEPVGVISSLDIVQLTVR